METTKIFRPWVLAAATALCLMPSIAATANEESSGITHGRALQMLIDGNARFVGEKSRYDNRDAAYRSKVALGQRPVAEIVGCSDSRVPAEVIFDQGLGALFVVRTAGQVTSAASIGSIEYAVEHLGSQLIVVLGHERCGAVDAAVKGGSAPGQIGYLIKAIKPAVKSVRKESGPLLSNSVKANVKMVVSKLRTTDPILKSRIDKNTLRVVGAHYDLKTGIVSIVPVSDADMKYWKRMTSSKK
ncbi:MAG: hypothetical protein C4320_06745 [Armatimonadota bacterium]